MTYHLHSFYSLCDSTTDFHSYVDKAIEEGRPAIAFTEHGNIYKWVEKKLYCDKKKIKYIHGIEAYLTQGNKFGKIRDNYHIVLLAKNEQGVKEINRLFSLSSLEDHKYYDNRITFEEFLNISDNVITTSACLGGVISKVPEIVKELENKIETLNSQLPALFAKQNKMIASTKTKQASLDKVNKAITDIEEQISVLKDNIHYLREQYIPLIKKFDYLEIQPHNNEEQKACNKTLVKYSKKYNIPLIAGTDTHSIDDYSAGCRRVLIADKVKDAEKLASWEDACDLRWKTYDELVEVFKQQGALPEAVYLEAIENTNRMAAQVEDFELDLAFKYPNIPGVTDEEKALQQRINECFQAKRAAGIIDPTRSKEYIAQIQEEFRVFKKIGMLGFILFMSNLMQWCRENHIPTSPCRGSVGGCLIAYITDIINVDPIKWHTIFSRFANEDRREIGDFNITMVALYSDI